MEYKLFTPEEIKKIDQRVLENIKMSDLIDEVGSALCKWFLKNVENKDSIAILCGPGNNGKDGKALGYHLKKMDYSVKMVDLKDIKEHELKEDIIVDSIFGISFKGELPTDLQKFISLNQHKRIISIDVPSGLDSESGEVRGLAFKADTTLAIAGLKPGYFFLPGKDYVGNIVIINIESLTSLYLKSNNEYVGLDTNDMSSLPKQNFGDHKYTRGLSSFVMSEEYPGAAILAAKAAQAVGSGYVKIYAPKKIIIEAQLRYPDLVFKPYVGLDEIFKKIQDDEKIDSLCLGVGWPSDIDIELDFFKNFDKDLLIDGSLMRPNILEVLKEKKNVVFTPHKGEQDRAFGNINKFNLMRDFYKEYKGVLVSKGYDTLIGQVGHPKVLSLTNSTKLSVAGTGDVLAGAITGLMAHGLSVYQSSLMAQRLQFLGAESSFQRISPLDLIESIKGLNLDGSN